MVEFYFKMKVILGIIGAIIASTLILSVIIWMVISTCNYNKKASYMKSIGFEYKLQRVSSTGGDDIYWWVRESTNERVYDFKLDRMKFKDIKNKYKKVN